VELCRKDLVFSWSLGCNLNIILGLRKNDHLAGLFCYARCLVSDRSAGQQRAVFKHRNARASSAKEKNYTSEDDPAGVPRMRNIRET
jgi:hypothetical protein